MITSPVQPRCGRLSNQIRWRLYNYSNGRSGRSAQYGGANHFATDALSIEAVRGVVRSCELLPVKYGDLTTQPHYFPRVAKRHSGGLRHTEFHPLANKMLAGPAANIAVLRPWRETISRPLFQSQG
jgi:hypothetical protein